MSCANCGDGPPNDGLHHSPTNNNPLDCNTRFIQCGNPCNVRPGVNTPACESLPSQIQNFTLQFFGDVLKTEVDGNVVWSLPCSLDVGLPNNPRGIDEGLACYFLRLFHDGIVGLTGPAGDPGTPGTNGNNAYTVTLKSFTQPTLTHPILQVVTSANPAILVNTYVFIDGSGWYLVQETDGAGVLLLSLVQPIASATGTIPSGRLVVPSGFPGASVQGKQGLQGPKGDTGPAGQTFTSVNGFYFADVGTDYALQIVYAAVNFTNSAPTLLLPTAGKYLVTAVVDVVGTAGVATTDIASFKLVNTSIAADIDGSEHLGSVTANLQRQQVAINSVVTTDQANQTIALYGKATSANVISAVALHTTMTYVKLQ